MHLLVSELYILFGMFYFKFFSESTLSRCKNKSLTGQTDVKKLSDYRTWTDSLGLQEVDALRTARQSAHESGKVVCPTQRPPSPPGNIPDSLFLLEADRPQGSSKARRIM